MYLSNIIKTFLSKAGILVINFLLIILTTHLWGAEGRGTISILLADIAVISIINNVLAGSSVSFFTPKMGIDRLILPAYIWIFLLTPVSAVIINLFQNHGNIIYLLIIAILNSIFTSHLFMFTGKENFKLYNFFSLLTPILTFTLILVFVFILKLKSVESYIYCICLAIFITWVMSFFKITPYFLKKPSLSWQTIKEMMHYGWQIEFSNILQFLSYRLSYYFILFYLGMGSVGIFSVGIALAESIWMISRSIATVQYAKIINNIDNDDGINITKSSLKLSMISSLLVIILLLIVPTEVYGFIFGPKFLLVKKIILLLFPGIITIAMSNIYGYYFSAVGKTRILIIKSLLGVIVTIGFSILLIPKWGISGACITATLSYITSSGCLFFAFHKMSAFRFKDILITKADLNIKF